MGILERIKNTFLALFSKKKDNIAIHPIQYDTRNINSNNLTISTPNKPASSEIQNAEKNLENIINKIGCEKGKSIGAHTQDSVETSKIRNAERTLTTRIDALTHFDENTAPGRYNTPEFSMIQKNIVIAKNKLIELYKNDKNNIPKQYTFKNTEKLQGALKRLDKAYENDNDTPKKYNIAKEQVKTPGWIRTRTDTKISLSDNSPTRRR